MKTAYKLLGLNRDAALIDVEHSYRHLLNMHATRRTDKLLTKDEQRRLRELREAYLLLSCPSRRLAYDRSLHARKQRRNRRIRTTISALSLLGGVLLIGAGLHSADRHDSDEVNAASSVASHSRAIAQAEQQSHDDASNAHHAHN